MAEEHGGDVSAAYSEMGRTQVGVVGVGAREGGLSLLLSLSWLPVLVVCVVN